MKIRKLIASVLTGGIILTSGSAFAMPTDQFDAGMEKGISYFNQGLYYEARDEFQWFADYNWGALNEGQQQYLLDYLGAAKREIQNYESTTRINTDIFQYLGTWYDTQNSIIEMQLSHVTDKIYAGFSRTRGKGIEYELEPLTFTSGSAAYAYGSMSFTPYNFYAKVRYEFEFYPDHIYVVMNRLDDASCTAYYEFTR